MHVANDELRLNLTESALVRWIREDTETGLWQVGCQIQGEIDEDVLIDLAECGLLDRRDSVRHRVTGEALAQWELGDDIVPV